MLEKSNDPALGPPCWLWHCLPAAAPCLKAPGSMAPAARRRRLTMLSDAQSRRLMLWAPSWFMFIDSPWTFHGNFIEKNTQNISQNTNEWDVSPATSSGVARDIGAVVHRAMRCLGQISTATPILGLWSSNYGYIMQHLEFRDMEQHHFRYMCYSRSLDFTICPLSH